jgi:ribosomal protein S27E
LLRDTFKEQFSEDCLKNPQKRLLEQQWQKLIQQLRDMLVVCPKCGDETFVEDTTSPKCMCCGTVFDIPGILRISNRTILLTPQTKVYIDMDNKPDMMAFEVAGDRYPVQLRNVTASKWTIETPSGKVKTIEPNEAMPVKAGLKVTIGTIKAEIN